MSGTSGPEATLPHSALVGGQAEGAADAAAFRWLAALAIALVLLACLIITVGYLLYEGVEVWGNNIPVTWALDIVSYDWWMGIGCGAIAVAAVRRLAMRQDGRDTLTRMAETVALFAACTAAIYPIIHLGRPWFFYWNLPYPNSFDLWPQFRSPLFWDAMDILAFLTVSLLLWYMDMVPDLAVMRDRERRLRPKQLYGIAALGWRGAAAHWAWWRNGCRILALLAILAAVLVQSGASVMYAGTLEPGWHDTLLPVTFLVGAVLSGIGIIAAVAGLRVALSPSARLHVQDLQVLARALRATSLAAIYCYAFTWFYVALSGDGFDRGLMQRQLTGPYAWAWWLIVWAALLPPQLFWLPAIRRSPAAVTAIGFLVAIGMWGDHVMTIVTTLHHDFLPSSAHTWHATIWSMGTFAGTVGLFLLLLLGALRWLPRLAAARVAAATGELA